MSLTKTILCYRPDCGHVIAMSPAVEAQFRRTHADFRCPAGHIQHFPQETQEEKTIRVLRARLADLEQATVYYREIIAEQRIEMRSLRARLGWRNHWLSSIRSKVAA